MSSYLMNEMIYSNYLVGFLVMYVLSVVVVWEGGDWLMVWMGMEMNMMSFIVLIYKDKYIEGCLSYFFIQTLGSSLILGLSFANLVVIEDIFVLILSYSIGAGPFYFWFPAISEGLSWMSLYFLMTLQKIIPLIVMQFMVGMMFWMIIVVSLIGGVLGAWGEVCLKRLMSFSSIYHVGWMMLGGGLYMNMWEAYYMGYMVMLSGVILVLSMNEVVKGVYILENKWLFVLGVLSLGGMPPLLGFFLKWWVFKKLIYLSLGMFLMLIVLSVMMFYLYFRVLYGVISGGYSIKGWGKSLNMMKGYYEVGFLGGLIFGPTLMVVL